MFFFIESLWIYAVNRNFIVFFDIVKIKEIKPFGNRQQSMVSYR